MKGAPCSATWSGRAGSGPVVSVQVDRHAKTRRLDNENRTADFSQNALCGGADRDTGRTGHAKCSHDQKVDAVFSDAPQNGFIRSANLVGDVDPDWFGQIAVFCCLELISERLVGMSEHAAVVILAGLIRKTAQPQVVNRVFDRMQ